TTRQAPGQAAADAEVALQRVVAVGPADLAAHDHLVAGLREDAPRVARVAEGEVAVELAAETRMAIARDRGEAVLAPVARRVEGRVVVADRDLGVGLGVAERRLHIRAARVVARRLVDFVVIPDAERAV